MLPPSLKLRDVCELIVDCEHKTAPTQNEGYPSIRTPNIGRGRLLLDGVNRVSEETYTEWTKRAVPQPGDLILAREAPIGNVAMISPALRVCLGQRTVLLRANRAVVDPHYLLYLLLGPTIQGKAISLATGATVGHLNVKDIKQLELPEFPTMSVQKKIGAVLAAYDDLIENNLHRIRILEEIARNIFTEWIVKPGPENGKPKNGWQVRSIMEVPQLRFISENVEQYDGSKLYHATADVEGISMVKEGIWYEYSKKPSRAQKQPKCNSVWFARMRDSRKVLCFADANRGATNQVVLSSGFAGFEASPGWLSFLYYTVNSEDFHRSKDQLCTGATQMALTNDGLARIRIVVPPDDIVVEYDAAVNPIINEILTLQAQNEVLRKSRDLLLPRLISGELNVSDLDIKVEDDKL